MTDVTSEVFAAYPRLRITHDNIAHYQGLMDGKLLINRCSQCGYWIYPHRPMCPKCLSWEVIPTEVSGDGKVYMFTLIYQERDPNAPIREPFPVVAVELVEQPGLRYLSTIVNCPSVQITYEMPVRLAWVNRNGRPWPAFEPRKGQ